MTTELRSERRGSTLLLTLYGAGSRNTITAQVCAAGVESLNVAETDAAVRCVVLQGEGADFCDGLEQPPLFTETEASPVLERLHGFVEALRVFPKPVIAAVEGRATGAGLSLALACDLLVAADNARFTLQSDANRRVTPVGGLSWHLARALPRAVTLQWAWLNEGLDASTLERHGLVCRLAAPGQALAQALRLAQSLGAVDASTLEGLKELVDAAPQQTLQGQMSLEAALFMALSHRPTGQD